MGIDAVSNFSAADYRSLADGGAYDPRFDIVALAPDGRLVANCVAWADRASGIAVFEPVGVHPDFRGRRLAAAVMAEALPRLAADGLETALVGTAYFNASAIAAYAGVFTLAGRSSFWSLSI
jgi:GNAT superfamily N-acetyltransferase